MKKIFIIVTIILIIVLICIGFKVLSNNNYSDEGDNIVDDNSIIKEIKVIIDDKEYSLVLEDNDTTRELLENLPLNIKMDELNGNEKYVYMDRDYPTSSVNPKHIIKVM